MPTSRPLWLNVRMAHVAVVINPTIVFYLPHFPNQDPPSPSELSLASSTLCLSPCRSIVEMAWVEIQLWLWWSWKGLSGLIYGKDSGMDGLIYDRDNAGTHFLVLVSNSAGSVGLATNFMSSIGSWVSVDYGLNFLFLIHLLGQHYIFRGKHCKKRGQRLNEPYTNTLSIILARDSKSSAFSTNDCEVGDFGVGERWRMKTQTLEGIYATSTKGRAFKPPSDMHWGRQCVT